MYWYRSVVDRIKRYYLDTYIRLPEYSNMFLRVSEVKPDYVRCVSETGDIVEVNLNNGYNMTFELPANRIYFQHGNNAYMLVRIPARQYLRGFSESNTLCYKIKSDGGFSAVHLSFELLNSYGNKLPYASIKEAITKFHTTKLLTSVALTHRICLTSRGRLLLDNLVVGMVSAKKRTINILPPFAAMLHDFLETTTDTFDVVVKSEVV